jgi:hypothetical protein
MSFDPQDSVFPGNLAAFEELKAAIRSGSILPFIGAGASAPVYPTWKAFLKKEIKALKDDGLVVHLNDEAELTKLLDTDLLELASLISRLRDPVVFRAKLAATFARTDDATTIAHDIIVNLFPAGAITTNFDQSIEVSIAKIRGNHATPICLSDEYALRRWMQNPNDPEGGAGVIHIHGVSSRPDTLILTADDYHIHYNDREAGEFIKRIWSENNLLFIGFGLSDPYLMYHAESIMRSAQTDVKHFALIGTTDNSPLSSFVRQRLTTKWRLRPVFYGVQIREDGTEDHGELEKILADLVAALTPATSPTSPPVSLRTSETASPAPRPPTPQWQRKLENNLLVGPAGVLLYVPPNLRVPSSDESDGQEGPTSHLTISELDIALSSDSYVISSRPEYGLTTLCSRLYEIIAQNQEVHFYNCDELPNYKKRLIEFFESIISDKEKAVLILDNFDSHRHERLLRELVSTGLFYRYIVSSNNFDVSSDLSVPHSSGTINFKPVILEHVNRSGIRHLVQIYFETTDNYTTSPIVDRIYGDLIALCIPLIPSNIIMYLEIICREGDFHPVNRVQILDKYIYQMLSRPGDIYIDKFSFKNKIDVISGFIYSIFVINQTNATKEDWFRFCRAYQEKTLTEFDPESLLRDLLTARVMLEYEGRLFLRYRILFSYFLGIHFSSKSSLVDMMLETESYLKVDSLMEVVTARLADNSTIVANLVEKVVATIGSLTPSMTAIESDPMASVIWPRRATDDGDIWEPIAKQLSAAPLTAAEEDNLKRSVLGEQATKQQEIFLNEYEAQEERLGGYVDALIEVLRNSEPLDGSEKKRAMAAIIAVYFVVYRAGLSLAKNIAVNRFSFWNGALFINDYTASPDDLDAVRRRTISVMASMARVATRRAIEVIGTKRLGQVFVALSKDRFSPGFHALFLFQGLIRTKPKGWIEATESIVRSTNRNNIYMIDFLRAVIQEFREQVNTVSERAALKRIVAIVRARRDLGHESPGERVIAAVLAQLEKADAFKSNES